MTLIQEFEKENMNWDDSEATFDNRVEKIEDANKEAAATLFSVIEKLKDKKITVTYKENNEGISKIIIKEGNWFKKEIIWINISHNLQYLPKRDKKKDKIIISLSYREDAKNLYTSLQEEITKFICNLQEKFGVPVDIKSPKE